MVINLDGLVMNEKKICEEKELIVYSLGAIGKKLYDEIYRVGNKMLIEGTNKLPFKPKLDIRGCGKRFVVDVAIQCLEYLIDLEEE